MNKGNYPTSDLLEKYNLLDEYGDVVQAVVAGDLGALEKILSSKQDIFVRSGVLITMEKLRLVTLRNFVRRIAAAVKSDPDLQRNKNKPSHVDLYLIFGPL